MKKVVVLASSGVESSILIANFSKIYYVYPLYIQSGFYYEEEEMIALNKFIKALSSTRINDPIIIKTELDNIYEFHPWVLSGKNIPPSHADDTSVMIHGRNTFLITMAALWCAGHDVDMIALGILGNKAFYDQEEAFFEKLAESLSHGMNQKIKILTPFWGLEKSDIIKSNANLPLYLTLTCIRSQQGIHCGTCNKCHERRMAFNKAGVKDLTEYKSV